MATQDRTREFFSTVESMRTSRGLVGAAALRAGAGAGDAGAAKSKFHTVAKNIAGKITETYDKLEKLTILASRRGLYDDRCEFYFYF